MGKKKLAGGAKYSRKEVLELKSLFDTHDNDGSGEVNVAELVSSITAASPHMRNQALSAFNCLDLDHNGKVTFREYLAVYYPYATTEELATMHTWAYPRTSGEAVEHVAALNSEQVEELRQMFALFDTNKNGVLERHEVVNAAAACGYDSEELEEMFEAVDADKNQALSFDEFVDLLKVSYLE